MILLLIDLPKTFPTVKAFPSLNYAGRYCRRRIYFSFQGLFLLHPFLLMMYAEYVRAAGNQKVNRSSKKPSHFIVSVENKRSPKSAFIFFSPVICTTRVSFFGKSQTALIATDVTNLILTPSKMFCLLTLLLKMFTRFGFPKILLMR